MQKYFLLDLFSRGVPRIFERGFPSVEDQRCRGLGVQSLVTDKLLIFKIGVYLTFDNPAEYYIIALIESTIHVHYNGLT